MTIAGAQRSRGPRVAGTSNVSPSRREPAGCRSRPQSAARSHRQIHRRRADRARDAAAGATGLIGGAEGRARAKERVDDDAAAVGEIEKGADAYVVHHNTKQLKFTPGSTGFSD